MIKRVLVTSGNKRLVMHEPDRWDRHASSTLLILEERGEDALGNESWKRLVTEMIYPSHVIEGYSFDGSKSNAHLWSLVLDYAGAAERAAEALRQERDAAKNELELAKSVQTLASEDAPPAPPSADLAQLDLPHPDSFGGSDFPTEPDITF